MIKSTLLALVALSLASCGGDSGDDTRLSSAITGIAKPGEAEQQHRPGRGLRDRRDGRPGDLELKLGLSRTPIRRP